MNFISNGKVYILSVSQAIGASRIAKSLKVRKVVR